MTNEIIETVCPECGAHIEEVNITEEDEEIVCTACGEFISIESCELPHKKGLESF